MPVLELTLLLLINKHDKQRLRSRTYKFYDEHCLFALVTFSAFFYY